MGEHDIVRVHYDKEDAHYYLPITYVFVIKYATNFHEQFFLTTRFERFIENSATARAVRIQLNPSPDHPGTYDLQKVFTACML